MILDPNKIAQREKLILAGLFLAKFDGTALKRLGFKGFAEAYNTIGYALGAKPASIKNYRDEFDPLFPNRRSGWHKRGVREYCQNIFDEYNGLDLEQFAGLIGSFAGAGEKTSGEPQDGAFECAHDSSFAKRLITGLAAEQYFESIHTTIPVFANRLLENTTRLGCGYDYCLRSLHEPDFLAIEVKGISGPAGGVSFTPKEYNAAELMRERFFLFLVKDFRKRPVHEIFQDPLSSRLRFRRTEQVSIQISWTTSV